MQPALAHLETFLLAAERGSFTPAPRALGLSQAAVSQRIQQLEAELGTVLFERGAGHVVLSGAGQALVPFAQRIALLHDEARQAVTGRKAPLTGTLEIAASSVPGEHF